MSDDTPLADLRFERAGEVIRHARTRAGFTSQKEFARRLGMPVSTLSRYESGQRSVTLDVIRRVAEASGQPEEVLALACLKAAYPRLGRTKVGRLLDRMAQAIQEIDRQGRR